MEDNLNNVEPVNTAGVPASVPVSEGEKQVTPQSIAMAGIEASKLAQSVVSAVQVPEMLKPVQGQPAVTNDEKIWGLVSYIPMMALMALVLKPSSGFIKLHGRQGLLIFLIFFFNIFVYLVPYIGPLIGGIIHFAMIGIGIFSMYQAFIGNWFKIPILGDVAELIPVEIFGKVTREAILGVKVSEEIEQKSVEEQETKAEEAAIITEDAIAAEQATIAQPPVSEAPVVATEVPQATIVQAPIIEAAPKVLEINENTIVPEASGPEEIQSPTVTGGDIQQQLPIADGEAGVDGQNK